jgi:hypothetical protein
LLCRTIRIETGARLLSFLGSNWPIRFTESFFTDPLDADLLAVATSLVNAMIAGEKVLSDRMRLRGVFKQHLSRTFAKQRHAFSNALPLMKQLDAFLDMEERDNVCSYFISGDSLDLFLILLERVKRASFYWKIQSDRPKSLIHTNCRTS